MTRAKEHADELQRYEPLAAAGPLLRELVALVERLSDEQERWKTWGIIEIAVRNPNVSSYVEHWESRTLKAEAQVRELVGNEARESNTCGGCGGPHQFDTSVPSVLWNRVVRPLGISDYLCATCILKAFAAAGVSFTAELWGDGFDGMPIEVVIGSDIYRTSRGRRTKTKP